MAKMKINELLSLEKTVQLHGGSLFMRVLIGMTLACFLCAPLKFVCLAQSGIITAFVGPQLPVNGAQAIADATSVAPDGAGGFYVTSLSQHQVYKVAADGTLKLVVGNRNRGFSGDGGPATSAQLNNPHGAAIDSAGNLYIADSGNQRIRKVSSSGIISTVAGNGTSGFGGDGGLATSALLNSPHGVAIDSAGNFFIADSGNQRIRKVSSSGIISTVAGNGTPGFGGDGGLATSAQLAGPYGVAIDSTGNLFVTDPYSGRIRKVAFFGIISTVAGNGNRGFSGDGGPATSAQLNNPHGVAIDSTGNLFIADTSNSRIRKVAASGIISTVAGNGISGFSGDGGQATSALLYYPYGVAIDSAGNLFIADTSNSRIRKVASSGIISTVAGNGNRESSGDGGLAASLSAVLNVPRVAVPVSFNCSSGNRLNWEKVPKTVVSRDSAILVRFDTNSPATVVPDSIKSRLESLHAEYRFQWDEKRLYGYVEVKGAASDSQQPKTSQKVLDDSLYNSLMVQIGAPSWRHWITEMHALVQPPNAPEASMFRGRTGAEEEFRKLLGEAIACPSNGGWIAQWAVAWLPFEDWQPKIGTTADFRLILPLLPSREGYALATLVPFVLTK
jgi:sugar lactone lactonase YvrE